MGGRQGMPVRKFHAWLQKERFLVIVGSGGVCPSEPEIAKAWDKVFTYLVVAVSITLLVQWELELLGELPVKAQRIINYCVWLFFLVKLIVLMTLVGDRWRFLRQNWLLPLVIILGAPVLIESANLMSLLVGLRPILAIAILFPAIWLFIRFFIDGHLTTTLLAASSIVIIFGVLVAGIDPNIKTPWDGIWWAVATVSTIGYGDVVPTSALGRLVGVGLVVLGLGIFAVVTANFLALVLSKEVSEVREEEKEVKKIYAMITEMSEHHQSSQRELKKLMEKIEVLEQVVLNLKKDEKEK